MDETTTTTTTTCRGCVVHKQPPAGSLLLSGFDPANVQRRDVGGVDGAFLLDGVFSREECEALVLESESLGFEDAGIAVTATQTEFRPDLRDNKRAYWQPNDGFLVELGRRLLHHAPETVSFREKGSTWNRMEGKEGFYERFSFYRYGCGECFAPHRDGWSVRREGFEAEASMLTCILYLNGDELDGGETTFFPNGDPSGARILVHPKRGSALLFWHTGPKSPLHEGSPHRSPGGFKHVLRTNIVYKLNACPWRKS